MSPRKRNSGNESTETPTTDTDEPAPPSPNRRQLKRSRKDQSFADQGWTEILGSGPRSVRHSRRQSRRCPALREQAGPPDGDQIW